MSSPNQFVVHRLRSKPVEYTVTIKHFVSGGDWVMSVMVGDVSEDPENRFRVAADLEHAARMLRDDNLPATFFPTKP